MGQPSFLSSWVARAPLALPLLAVLGVYGGSWAYGLVFLALAFALFLREWRIAFCCILLSAVGWVHIQLVEDEESAWREALLSQGNVHVQGHVVRESEHSLWLQLQGSSVRVELRGDALKGRLGDAVSCWGQVEDLPEVPEAGIFNRRQWLQDGAVVAQLYVVEMSCQAGSWWTLARWQALSASLREGAAKRLMPSGTQGDARRQVLCALILGERDLAEQETLHFFLHSGTLHAFAVSGLHVGLLAAMLLALMAKLQMKPQHGRVLLLILLAAYVFLTGMAVASLRAYLMVFLFVFALMVKRPVQWANLLCFAALLILMLEPRQMTQAGFLLSFVVYAAIGVTAFWAQKDSPWFGPSAFIPEDHLNRRQKLLLRGERLLRGTFILSASAWLASLPICLYYFKAFSTYGILSNMVMTPLLPLVMACGLLMLLLGGLPLLGPVVSWCALQGAGLLLMICEFFAGLPHAYVKAYLPRQAHEGIILHLPYGDTVCLLGNPGLLIHGCKEQSARWSVCPMLEAEGFRASLIVAEARQYTPAATAYMHKHWQAEVVDCDILEAGATPCIGHYQVGENHYEIYPAPCEMKGPLIEDRLPVIKWTNGGQSVLYVGYASAATVYYWLNKGADLSAEILIVGRNRKQSFVDYECIGSFRRVIELEAGASKAKTQSIFLH